MAYYWLLTTTMGNLEQDAREVNSTMRMFPWEQELNIICGQGHNEKNSN